MGNANNSAVQTMLNSGADAQKNMFDIWIKFPWSDEYTPIGDRCKGFQVPEAATGTTERNYHGSKITVPTSQIDINRSLSLTFRLDASYSWFQQFISWHSTTADPISGGVSNWANATGEIKVKQLSGTYAATGVSNYIDDTDYTIKGDTNATWTFYDVWVNKVTEPNFDSSGGGELEFTVEFVFGDCDYPFYNMKGITGTGSGGGTTN